MGLHTGEAEVDPAGDEYAVSHTKNRAARIMSAAHGGQILLSQESTDLVQRTLTDGVTLKDLGEHLLKGMQQLEHLYQVLKPGLLADFPPLATSVQHLNNLPVQLTSFIGREREIGELTRLLEKQRLVTLTGSGGTGKTRLALQVAASLLDAFPDGVWFVELAPLADPLMVPQTVIAALGLIEQSGKTPSAFLADYRGRSVRS